MGNILRNIEDVKAGRPYRPVRQNSISRGTQVRKTLKDLDLYVRFSIIVSIIFTIAILVLFAFTQTEPDTLITCFFAMFGGEIFSCAMIKLFKMKWRENDDGSDTDDPNS